MQMVFEPLDCMAAAWLVPISKLILFLNRILWVSKGEVDEFLQGEISMVAHAFLSCVG